jgi:hypothetical protein
VVLKMGFDDGFVFVQREVGHACDVVVVLVDQFHAVFVRYEAVVFHFRGGLKNIFCFVTFYPIVCYVVFGRRSDTLYEKVKFNFFGKNINI